MSGLREDRRVFLKNAAALAPMSLLARPAIAQGAAGRVVVIGGGFAGATCARAVKSFNPRIEVTLVEANRAFVACPFSNEVIAGLRELEQQTFGYDALTREGIALAFTTATGVDAQARIVTLSDGARLAYDRLVLAPGVDLRFDALPGYDAAAAEIMPHAWKAGAQTILLRRRLESMEDGGTVVISVPANPYRCPPGPYERASLIAYYLMTKKPKSKVVILDAKDAFSKQKLFENAWTELYPGMIEWISLSAGGKTTQVDAKAMTVTTEFDVIKASVANVIPPQRAGRIAEVAGVADRTGWCPIEPATFASTLQRDMHVVGDAAIAGAMPKSAFAANAQGKACALAVVESLAGRSPPEPRLINTCYSLAAPGYGVSVAGVYRPVNGQWLDVDGAGGTSPINAPRSFRAQEAVYADGWFKTITADVFG